MIPAGRRGCADIITRNTLRRQRGEIIFEAPNLVQEPRDRFSEVQDLVQEPEDGFIEAPGLVQEPEDGAPGLVQELLVVDVHAPHSPSLVSPIVPWQGHEGTKVGFCTRRD